MIISILAIGLYFVIDSVSVDVMLRWGYIMLGIAVACVILFPAIAVIQNPKSATNSLLGLAIIAVVVGVSSTMASGDPVITPGSVYDDPFWTKLTDIELFTMYFFLIATVVVILYGEIRNAFK
jgi:hypothetical protein